MKSYEHYGQGRLAPRHRGLIFLCDHASNAIPPAYDDLALPQGLLQTHIAYDIGAATVTRALADHYDTPAILACWSRLLVDLNRGADDPTIVMKLSDGSIIPGNRHADAAEIAHRIAKFHAPYHHAIAENITALQAEGIVPILISMHSFTPSWKGAARPWDIGILWDRDDRLAKPLLSGLARAGFTVGDNEPYRGALENDCLYTHGTMGGLPHVLIEIRQDLIATDEHAHALAARIAPVLDEALAQLGTPGPHFTRPLNSTKETAMKEPAMDEKTREQLEAAAFRRLVAHLRSRTDVQNIDLMTLAGFCRNCLGDWYGQAAAERGIALDKEQAREIIYGMAPAEWKRRYQREASPEQQAAFAKAQKTHS